MTDATITVMGSPDPSEPLADVIARLEASIAKDADVGTKAAAHWHADVRRLIDAARPVSPPVDAPFDLVAHLHRQREFSRRTFGPGARTAGMLDHIRKELAEIEADPADISEWVDVVILAFDGAWRAGWEPEAIVAAIVTKQTKNEGRTWPDWRTVPTDKAIEHDRSGEARAVSPPVDAETAALIADMERMRDSLNAEAAARIAAEAARDEAERKLDLATIAHSALQDALFWVDTYDPETVAAAEERFDFKLIRATPAQEGGE